jgi:hypothetical protein
VTASTVAMRPKTAVRAGLSEELIRLAYLCQAGVLTPDEFESAKARTVAEFRTNPATE